MHLSEPLLVYQSQLREALTNAGGRRLVIHKFGVPFIEYIIYLVHFSSDKQNKEYKQRKKIIEN